MPRRAFVGMNAVFQSKPLPHVPNAHATSFLHIAAVEALYSKTGSRCRGGEKVVAEVCVCGGGG
jgi:hypothetical protein